MLLQAPSKVQTGAEFIVRVNIESEAPLRNGNLNFSFDASRMKFVGAEAGTLLQSGSQDPGFRYSASEGTGRVALGIAGKGDVKGSGELARLRFQAIAEGQTTSAIRLEALSMTDASGRMINAQLPPPLALSFSR